MEQVCKKCKESKSLDEFKLLPYVDDNGVRRHRGTCIDCERERNKEYHKRKYVKKYNDDDKTRVCKTCSIEKQIEDFDLLSKPRKDGTLGRRTVCSSCEQERKRKVKREYYLKNEEYIKEKQREYRVNNRDKRYEYQKEWQRKNKDKLAQYQKKYFESDKGIQKRREATNRYRFKPENKIKEEARMLVKKAISEGELVRPDYCSKCGVEAYVECHHKDYTKPLEVDWLCKPCHEEEHHAE
ncbi:homing endonuclease [Bacillus phage vB_BceH_LY2]|nr:homing endonuclease [Bacillus phage vB_BceH_LY2]